MADDVNQQIDDALKIVKLTDQSGNLKKELKNEIHETVSSLRNLIFTLKENLNERTNKNSELQNEVNGLKKDLEAHRQTQTVGQWRHLSAVPWDYYKEGRDNYTT
jgi:predicted  nucleic acid-binding Zn-ribbon protein